MKITLIILSTALLCSCGKTETKQFEGVAVTVIEDRTDSLAAQPSAGPILNLFDFPNAIDQAATLRLVVVTDKTLNVAHTIKIADGTTTERSNVEGDIDYREQLVQAFHDSVRVSVQTFRAKNYPKNGTLAQSECFATIASELSLLASVKASRKIALIFSDLRENNKEFSCYRQSDQILLKINPQKAANILLLKNKLPSSLVGITVYFIYQPFTAEEDKQYREIAAIYNQLLRERGAHVFIQANDNYFEP